MYASSVCRFFLLKLTISVDETRIDQLKVEFMQNRDEQGAAAKERYLQERIEAMKRYAGIKDDPTPQAKPITPSHSVQQGVTPTPILPTGQAASPAQPVEEVWTEDRPYGR